MLASVFGGGPAYWLDPQLDDDLLATAILVADPKRKESPGGH